MGAPFAGSTRDGWRFVKGFDLSPSKTGTNEHPTWEDEVGKIRIYLAAAALATFGAIGGVVTPANASHSCGLEPGLVNSICEGYHDIPQLLLCKIAPNYFC